MRPVTPRIQLHRRMFDAVERYLQIVIDQINISRNGRPLLTFRGSQVLAPSAIGPVNGGLASRIEKPLSAAPSC